MNPLIIAYSILGFTMIIALAIVILKIAGQEMYFALMRFFRPKGCEVYVINNDRQISRYYKEPKDGVFKIDSKPYVTNPSKLLNLDNQNVEEVMKEKDRRLKNLNKRIAELEIKREITLKQIRGLKDTKEQIPQLENLKMYWVDLGNKIELLKAKLEEREQAYFQQRRSAYFYIENDPVPKDFHEFYTEMDSVQLENVIIRAQTKDPKKIGDIQKEMAWLKRFILFALIASAIAGWFAFQNHSYLEQIANHLNIALTL